MGTVKTTTKIWTEVINERDKAKENVDFAIDILHKILDGKPGVNLSADGFRRYDIEIALAALKKLEG
jgi:hypothetical protein